MIKIRKEEKVFLFRMFILTIIALTMTLITSCTSIELEEIDEPKYTVEDVKQKKEESDGLVNPGIGF